MQLTLTTKQVEFFSQLPLEIFLHIALFLEIKDIISARQVCKNWQDKLSEENLSAKFKMFYNENPFWGLKKHIPKSQFEPEFLEQFIQSERNPIKEYAIHLFSDSDDMQKTFFQRLIAFKIFLTPQHASDTIWNNKGIYRFKITNFNLSCQKNSNLPFSFCEGTAHIAVIEGKQNTNEMIQIQKKISQLYQKIPFLTFYLLPEKVDQSISSSPFIISSRNLENINNFCLKLITQIENTQIENLTLPLKENAWQCRIL